MATMLHGAAQFAFADAEEELVVWEEEEEEVGIEMPEPSAMTASARARLSVRPTDFQATSGVSDFPPPAPSPPRPGLFEIAAYRMLQFVCFTASYCSCVNLTSTCRWPCANFLIVVRLRG